MSNPHKFVPFTALESAVIKQAMDNAERLNKAPDWALREKVENAVSAAVRKASFVTVQHNGKVFDFDLLGLACVSGL